MKMMKMNIRQSNLTNDLCLLYSLTVNSAFQLGLESMVHHHSYFLCFWPIEDLCSMGLALVGVHAVCTIILHVPQSCTFLLSMRISSPLHSLMSSNYS